MCNPKMERWGECGRNFCDLIGNSKSQFSMRISNSTMIRRLGSQMAEISTISTKIEISNFRWNRRNFCHPRLHRLVLVEFEILIENWDFEFPMRSQKFLPQSPHRCIFRLRTQNYEHLENFKIKFPKIIHVPPRMAKSKFILFLNLIFEKKSK